MKHKPARKQPRPRSTGQSGISPEWANLPRRKCANCGKSYKPNHPKQRFDNRKCANQYHKDGGAYQKLKGKLQPMMDKEMERIEERLREIVREELFRAIETREFLQSLRFADDSFRTKAISAP